MQINILEKSTREIIWVLSHFFRQETARNVKERACKKDEKIPVVSFTIFAVVY